MMMPRRWIWRVQRFQKSGNPCTAPGIRSPWQKMSATTNSESFMLVRSKDHRSCRADANPKVTVPLTPKISTHAGGDSACRNLLASSSSR